MCRRSIFFNKKGKIVGLYCKNFTISNRRFAKNLKKIRKLKGLSQLKLANELQMAFTFINDIENCKKWVSPETLAKFSPFLFCLNKKTREICVISKTL
ncbi:MAG: helix-turn-helix transcriptional regulator [Spirochaetaceae bacterium]|nr:helix-turn-helix transcriptional regulator [Spirochaetaceae bacterium]